MEERDGLAEKRERKTGEDTEDMDKRKNGRREGEGGLMGGCKEGNMNWGGKRGMD